MTERELARRARHRLLAAALGRAQVDWLVALDSTIVRAHQHTATKGGSNSAGSDAPAAG